VTVDIKRRAPSFRVAARFMIRVSTATRLEVLVKCTRGRSHPRRDHFAIAFAMFAGLQSFDLSKVNL